MHTRPEVDPLSEIRQRVDFLKNYLLKSGANGYALGISGGQDSTLAGKLAQLAVDELNAEQAEMSYSFYAVRLPYGEQLDENDAQEALRFINPTQSVTVNIKAAVDASVGAFQAATGRHYPHSIKGITKRGNA